MKIILVGVNHAGTAFLRTFKSLSKDAELVAYDKNTDISFLGCGIALWVGGEFENPDGLFYANHEILSQKFGVDVKMQHEVIEINSKEKYLRVKNLVTGEIFKDTFDKLVFAGGTWPIDLKVEGRDLKNIYFSKIFNHAKELHKKNNDPSIKNVVVVGAGYIGVELAEAFNKAGKNVVLIDMIDRVVPRYFDQEFTSKIEEKFVEEKIVFAKNQKVVKFLGQDGVVQKVVTNVGEYPADLVVVSVGFKPHTQILEKQVDRTSSGAIIVDNEQKTSNENIYAIGDSCALTHHILGTQHVALATNAVKTGVVAAFSLSGNHSVKFPGISGTNAISVFGLKYASTGISESVAKEMKISHKAIVIKDKDKPEFMHNAEDVQFKLVFDPKTLKILGAQIGSEKENHTEIIYTISLAIADQKTIVELALMDFFFLPHFNKPFNFIIKAVLEVLGLDYAKNN